MIYIHKHLIIIIIIKIVKIDGEKASQFPNRLRPLFNPLPPQDSYKYIVYKVKQIEY